MARKYGTHPSGNQRRGQAGLEFQAPIGVSLSQWHGQCDRGQAWRASPKPSRNWAMNPASCPCLVEPGNGFGSGIRCQSRRLFHLRNESCVEAAARKRRFLLNIVSLDESDMDPSRHVCAWVCRSDRLEWLFTNTIRPVSRHLTIFPRICRGRGRRQFRRRRLPDHQRRTRWWSLDDHAPVGSRPQNRLLRWTGARSY